MIDLPPSSRRTYSDNGDSAAPDRNPNRDHPRHSRGTWVAVAIGGSAVVGAGASMYASNKAAGAAGANAPAPRDLGGELTTIGGSLGGLTASAGDAYAGNAGRYAQTNQNSFNQTMQNGLPSSLRQNYDAANPQQAAFNTTMGNERDRLNSDAYWQPGVQTNTAQFAGSQGRPDIAGQYSQSLPGVQTNTATYTGAQASNAQFTPGQARATDARYNAAQGGPLSGALQMDAARNLGQVSGLQGQLQQQASSLLGAGGGLTQGETMAAQQSARAAYADRGRLRGNAGIGAEILGTDQAQRARLMQNAQFAQGVDASGQQQLNQNRGYAQGVQAQNQGLSQFNAGQQNQMGQFNAGQRTGISQFNTGQANQIGASLAQFNAGQNQQNSQFNATGINAMNQDAASRADANARFNYSGAAENSRFNAGQANDLARFNYTGANQNNQYNASGINAMNQDAAARGDANARFNYQGQLQQNNDAWGRTRDMAVNLGTQAINANEFGMRLSQGAPDYTGAVLGYGNDVANTNYNGAASRANSAANNSAALMGAGINSIGQMGNAFASYYGNRPPGSTAPGGAYGGGSSYG